MKKVEPEFISDVAMFLFFDKGMRSEVSYISKSRSKANNKYLKSYDPKQQSKHIIYLDTNNLCQMFLPTGRLKWIDPTRFDMNKYTRNSSKVCALEFDLEYPKELKELHNIY